ncbi:MAG: DEAD/DEAH box helicase, partial [Synechococcaceae cyanobacterium SM1_2_3]|nr:DEAD/DEAH box helicase [Synechococcaceae cyanobacterium SM1_2_3]
MSDYLPENPLIVQSDHTVLLETHGPRSESAREAITPFAELIKSPEHIHTYRITPLSIWNARAAGLNTGAMIATLRQFAKYPVPEGVAQEIESLGRRYGLAVIERDADGLILRVADAPLAELLARERKVAPLLGERLTDLVFRIRLGVRGLLKQALVNAGYPADDLAGYSEGQQLPLTLRTLSSGGEPFIVRGYQREAAAAFYQDGQARGGSGVIVLPCGAGKTIVGMATMALVQENTLILTTSQTSIQQWRRELLDKTDLPADAIAEYTSQHKNTGPVTLATYQMLTYRPSREAEFVHFGLFHARAWGLIIYDEVHLLPAPVFRVTAELQSRRRLGLTATLIREDGLESDVFALIGPKRYDAPWRELEGQGFIAAADCTEIRVAQTPERDMEYALAPRRNQFRVAAENPRKQQVVAELLKREAGHRILIIGEFISQVEEFAAATGFPLLTGKTAQLERERLYQAFRDQTVPGLVLSRVGNFAVDLPDADVLIQVSGKYGSRQEEAQRLGRVLRPKK